MGTIFIGLIVMLICIIIILAFVWYRIVPPSEAHLVVKSKGRMVCSPDTNVQKNGKAAYYKIPDFIPVFGRKVRVMDVTIKELIVRQETYEKNQARYNVTSSLKYRITDVETAAETFVNDQQLKEQLIELIKASVRAITVKFDVTDARSKKEVIDAEVEKTLTNELAKWGLKMVNFQLVDFQDTEDSSIISDISKRREVEIQSQTREQNAEKIKQARIKEAESEELAKSREIKKDEIVGMREQDKAMNIAEIEKLAREKKLEVERVQKVKTQEIEKERQLIEAAQKKEVEEINKEQKKLEGEGDRDKAIEQAKGEAAPIREKGLAEAEAKEKLQAALNKFKEEAIRALIAEKVVEKDKAIGIAGAEALGKADVKAFLGGGEGAQAFDVGKSLEALTVSNPGASSSILHRIGVPNDLGGGVPIKVANKKEDRTKLAKA